MKHFPPKDTSTRTSAIQKATHRITTKWLRLAVLAAGIVVTAGTSYAWPLDRSDAAFANVATNDLSYMLLSFGELAQTTTVTVAEFKGVATDMKSLVAEIRQDRKELHDSITNLFTKWGGWLAGILAGLRYGFSDKTVRDDVQSVKNIIKPKPQGDS